MQARLQYLELGSPDPEALALFYARALKMDVEAEAGAWTVRGRDRCLRFVAGEAKTLVSAGYAVEDPADLEALAGRLAEAGFAADRVETHLFAPGAVALVDPDGNRLVYGVPRTAASAAGPQGLTARLQHLVVASDNAARLVSFYADVVGLRESDRVYDGDGGMRTSFLRSDHEHHSLAVFQAPKSRLDHHCYEVGEWNLIRDWGDHFASLRIPVKWGPGRHGPGNNLFLFIHDPDGNWVELSAELEVVEDDRPIGRWPHEEYTLNSWGQGFLRS